MALLLLMPALVQAATVRGVVVDYETNKPIANVKVTIRKSSAITDLDGKYELKRVREGAVSVVFTAADYKVHSVDYVVEQGDNTLNMTLDEKRADESLNQQALEDNIFELDESMFDEEGSAASQSASYLSGAADDVYLQAASYSYSPMRFNVRGYEQRESSTYINGVNFNDLERGRFNYSSLGGLNNAMRNKDAVNGLEMPGYAFGSLGGTTNINTRATSYAAGTNVNAAYTNRAYKLRGQAIHSTGIMDNGWAFTGSVVYRWADEGRTEGTFYNSFGYFLAAEKVLDNHRFAFTTFGAPTSRLPYRKRSMTTAVSIITPTGATRTVRSATRVSYTATTPPLSSTGIGKSTTAATWLPAWVSTTVCTATRPFRSTMRPTPVPTTTATCPAGNTISWV